MVVFFVNLFLCFLLGCLYSLGELLSRFKNGKLIFEIFWGNFYIIFNGFLAALAFIILKDFNLDFGSYKQIEGGKIVVAGVSSMVIIRSWIISVAVPPKSSSGKHKKGVEASLAPLIQVFLDFVQREFDKRKAESDIELIRPIMADLDFEKAALSLPYTCSNLLVTISEEEGREIAKKVSELRKSSMDNATKLLNLGLTLNGFTGDKVLKKIAGIFREDMSKRSPYDDLNSLIESFEK